MRTPCVEWGLVFRSMASVMNEDSCAVLMATTAVLVILSSQQDLMMVMLPEC